MVVVETRIFTSLISQLMEDEQYRELQLALVENPILGSLIPGSGGLRKIRWKLPGTGKRGGVRVIYYRAASADQIRMLYVCAKNRQVNLTREQLKQLRQIVERW